MVDEAVRAQHGAPRRDVVTAGLQRRSLLADGDARDVGAIHEPEPARVAPFQIRECLLGQQPAVRGPLGTGQHRAVAVIVDVEQFAHARLRDDVIEPLEVSGKRVTELRPLRHHARLRAPPTLAADEVVAQMDLQVVQIEHPHVTGESLDPNGGARFGDHEVEQIVSPVETPLCLDGPLGAELIRDVAQRTLEVCRELPGVAAGRTARDTVALDQQHAAGRTAQDEEGGRHARDSGPDHGDVRRGIRLERLGRPVVGELRQPRRPGRLIGRAHIRATALAAASDRPRRGRAQRRSTTPVAPSPRLSSRASTHSPSGIGRSGSTVRPIASVLAPERITIGSTAQRYQPV